MSRIASRQIHLDFHTSPHIPDVGAEFDEESFVDTLTVGNVNSVTLFAKCHHGFSYHETSVGKRHPNLVTDLLRRQYDACRAAGIATPIYISAGWDELAADEHPEWVAVDERAEPLRFNTDKFARWRFMDLDSGYLDYLMAQIREVLTLFPETDGLFLDIIKGTVNWSASALASLERRGLDPHDPADRDRYAMAIINEYLQRVEETVRPLAEHVRVFHNQGIIPFGNRDYLRSNSHIEIENLPTGGWGYDSYPYSAAYVTNLGKPYLGMTGKFHSSWGEMGGYKHPDALRYECAVINAYGANVSVGDHLEPNGVLDVATYRNIGAAYAEVRGREPWVVDDRSLADVAVLPVVTSTEKLGVELENVFGQSDLGAARILLESQIPFDVLDFDMDWSRYRLLVLPDAILLNAAAAAKVQAFLDGGGKVLASGKSGLNGDCRDFAVDLGVEYCGPSELSESYVWPTSEIRPDFAGKCFTLYSSPCSVRARAGDSIAKSVAPYFDQSPQRFSGHLQTPANCGDADFDAVVMTNNTAYVAHPVFRAYAESGALAVKCYVEKIIRLFMGEDEQFRSNLPPAARVTLREQRGNGRAVMHLTYGLPQFRGRFRDSPIEVVQELPLLAESKVSLRLARRVSSARLQPENVELGIGYEGERLRVDLPAVRCSAVVELTYAD